MEYQQSEVSTGPALLTVDDIAKELQVSTESVRRWIHAGELPAMDMASRDAKKSLFRVQRRALEDFLVSRRTRPQQKTAPRNTHSRRDLPRVENYLGL